MADLSAIRQALADAITTTGLTGHATNPDQVHAPCALVEPGDVDFRGAMQRGHDKWTMMVRVLVAPTSNAAAQTQRDSYFGGVADLKDAIEGHVALRDGSAAQDVFVARAAKFDSWAYAETVYVGVELTVEVYA